MTGTVVTSKSSITRGFVRAIYARSVESTLRDRSEVAEEEVINEAVLKLM
jgi:hypothetical protein